MSCSILKGEEGKKMMMSCAYQVRKLVGYIVIGTIFTAAETTSIMLEETE